MKRLLAFLLIMLLLLAGCGKAPEEESAVAGEVVESTEEDGTEADRPVKVDPNQQGEVMADPGNGNGTNNGTNTDTPKDEGNTPSDTPNNTPSEQPNDSQEEEEQEEEDAPAVEYKEANKLKVLDYNIRCADDGANKMIDDRAPRLKVLVNQLDPDLIGFQEATPKWIAHIEADYGAKYAISYKYRAENSLEATPLLYKRDKFEQLDGGYFWLSSTPETSGKDWGADCVRICNWAKLKVKATGEVFLFYNTHFDGTKEFHINAGNLVMNRAKQQGGFDKYAVILTGDFNMKPWSPGYSNLVQSGDFSDINQDLEQDQSTTVSGYNEDDAGDGYIIDFTFYTPKHIVPLKYRVLNENINDGWISDHRGLYTEMALI